MPIGASLHIGLNAVDPKQYSGWDGQLTACEFDANDMQALAKAQGFTKVTKRLTKKATRNRVLADIKAAAAKKLPNRVARVNPRERSLETATDSGSDTVAPKGVRVKDGRSNRKSRALKLFP